MDAITLLRDDHKLVRRLFREFDQTNEHKEAKHLLDRIDGMSGDDADLPGLVEQLATVVIGHVKEEEGELFKQLRAEVGRKDLTEWGDQLKAAKRTAPTRPHPHAPNKPPANALVGTAAGAVDRVRDKARR